MNAQIPVYFEDQVRSAMARPAASPAFVEALALRLRQAQQAAPRRTTGWRPLRALSMAILVLALAAVLIIGPQRVLAQVLDWLGYVPGIGFVNQEGGLRVLAEPTSQTRDGITVTIEDGLIDAEHTWLTFYFEGIRQDQKPHTEDVAGCASNPTLYLPDGSILTINGGSGEGGPTWMREQFSFPALPADVNEATIRIPCVPEVLPGFGPEGWEFAVRFVPAPQGYEVLPVVTLPSASLPPKEESSANESRGIRLDINELVELDDGYLFRGELSWEQDLYKWIDFGGYLLEAWDAHGDPVAIEEVYDDSMQPSSENSASWSVRTNRKDIAGPIRIGLSQLAVQDASFESESAAFTLGFSGAEEQSWPLNEIIDIQGYEITMQNATLESWGDGTYALTLNLLTHPDEISLISFRDLDNQSEMLSGSGGGVPGGENFVQTLYYDYLPQGEHRFVVETFYHLLLDNWIVQVELAANTERTETPVPAVCLSQESWQSALASEQIIPVLEGRILLEDRSAPALLPNLILVRPDGTDPITIGQGSWAAISPDGRKAAYAYGGLRVMDVETLQTSLLITEDSSYAMAWAPDSQRIALIRGGDGVYLINADGTGLQRAPGSSADMIGIAGWLPDGQHIVVSRISTGGTLMQAVDLRSGQTEDLFLIDNLKGGFARLSPDGTHIVYSAGIFGVMNYGVYVANLDGSNQRLVAEPGDEFMFTMGAWSPDGRWVILNPYDVASYQPEPQHPLAIDLESCHINVFDQILGNVTAWGP